MSEEKNESSICLECGLCCNGTLFGFANENIHDNETGNFKNTQIKLIKHVKVTFRLPCVEYSENTGCQIYQERPKVCQTFRCNILKSIENKKLSREKCINLIRSAKTNREILSKYVNNKVCVLKPYHLLQKFMLLHGSELDNVEGIKAYREKNASIYDAYFALDYLLDYFLSGREKYKK